MDELQANVKHMSDYKNACVITLTQTWLKDYDPNQDFDTDGLIVTHRSPANHWEGACVCMLILADARLSK